MITCRKKSTRVQRDAEAEQLQGYLEKAEGDEVKTVVR